MPVHRREEHRGKENEENHVPAAEPDQRGQDCGDCGVRRHGTEPVSPSRSHQTDRKPVLQEEAVEGHDTEQEKRMADKAVEAAPNPAFRAVLGDRQRRQITDAAPVEVPGGGVVDGVGFAPDVIWRQRDHADCAAEPVAQPFAAEERSVAAIVLDHEQAHEEGRVAQASTIASGVL
jgi:hypothetical protein